MREVYRGFSADLSGPRWVPEVAFFLLRGRRIGSERAADVLGALLGRDVLLLAPAGDARLAAEIEAMYRSIPEQRDADGNLVLLPMTQAEGLFGEHVVRHRDEVETFFSTRL